MPKGKNLRVRIPQPEESRGVVSASTLGGRDIQGVGSHLKLHPARLLRSSSGLRSPTSVPTHFRYGEAL